MTDLTKMFKPDSVAIVGASNSEGKVGYIIVNNMINDGFKRKAINKLNSMIWLKN